MSELKSTDSRTDLEKFSENAVIAPGKSESELPEASPPPTVPPFSPLTPVDLPQKGNKRFRLVAVLGGILAGFALGGKLQELYGLTIPDDPFGVKSLPAVEVMLSLVGWLFAGFFSASLARSRHRLHGLAVGLGIVALISLNITNGALSASQSGIVDWLSALRAYLPWHRLFVLLAAPPFAYLGAELAVRLEGWHRLRSPRKEWDYLMKTGEAIRVSSPWQLPWLSRFWLFMALAFVAAWGVGAVWYFVQARDFLASLGEGGGGAQLLPVLFSVIWSAFDFKMLFLALSFYLLGSQYATGSVADRLRNDTRPPIVYLRSFNDDGRAMNLPPRFMIYHPFRALLDKTIEQRLVQAFSRKGPSIAIGSPKEVLPEMGASRLYVSDERWKNVVEDALDRAGAVVVIAGHTPGLRWEMNEVTSRCRPEDVLLFVPFPLTRDRSIREAEYAKFRAWANPLFPRGLPETISDAFFIYFTADPPWTPHGFARADQPPVNHPLAPILKKASRNWRFKRSLHLTHLGYLMDAVGLLAIAMISFIILWTTLGLAYALLGLIVELIILKFVQSAMN